MKQEMSDQRNKGKPMYGTETDFEQSEQELKPRYSGVMVRVESGWAQHAQNHPRGKHLKHKTYAVSMQMQD